MNISKFIIKNAKSFGEETVLDFHSDLNICIGPNAGGKSNLLDILNFTLNYFFLHSWRTTENRTAEGFLVGKSVQQISIFNPPVQFCEKHDKKQGESQEIKITFKLEDRDIQNIKFILENKDKLTLFEKENFNSENFQNNFLAVIPSPSIPIESIVGKEIEFHIKDYRIVSPQLEQNENQIYVLLLKYLNNFELVSLLAQSYNNSEDSSVKLPRLYPPIVYFSPYRIPQNQYLVSRLAGSDIFAMIETYRRNTSKNISSTFDFANNYFARKLRLLNNNIEAFAEDEEVKSVNAYIKTLGYKRFIYKEIDPINNTYQALIERKDGGLFEISKASSGEKEIVNILLGIFAFNIKDGIMIIDEPELHLHPLWQNTLVELFFDLADTRGIQFFIVTHSPHFITARSIKNVLRVYSENGISKVVISPILTENEKDLFLLVNLLNSAKIFFSDIVILVEGVVDRIVYEAVLKKLQKQINGTKIVEILHIDGIGSFDRFIGFLKKWSIQRYRIADLGYTTNDTDNLFILQRGSIEAYFQNVVTKSHYDIDDAIQIAKSIDEGSLILPSEIDSIFKSILSA